jgi:hypothetical protein
VIIKNRIESEDQRPKLALRKETLRQLTGAQLRQVAGGMGIKASATTVACACGPPRTTKCPTTKCPSFLCPTSGTWPQ